MRTVVRRTFRSTPHRDALSTWMAIVDLLTPGEASPVRAELLAVAGIAASVIADQAPSDAPIVVTCDGPRTRIYCIYGDDAVDGTGAREDSLGFDALEGDWRLSLPALTEDVDWIQRALQQRGSRITARDLDAAVATEDSASAVEGQSLVFDPKGFLGT